LICGRNHEAMPAIVSRLALRALPGFAQRQTLSGIRTEVERLKALERLRLWTGEPVSAVNGCRERRSKHSQPSAARSLGVSMTIGWEAGILLDYFKRRQQRRVFLAQLARTQRFSIFGFFRRLSSFRVRFRILPAQ